VLAYFNFQPLRDTLMILCLEFPCKLSPEQQGTVEEWLQISKFIYNQALYRLMEWDEFTGYWVKETKSYAPSCPIQWEYRKDKDSGERVPFSRIASEKSRWFVKQLPRRRVPTPTESKDSWGWADGWGYSCPLPGYYHEPLLQRWEMKAKGGLGHVVKGDYWPEGHPVLRMPYKFRSGVLTMLETPWQEYLKSRYGQTSGPSRGKPKFKRKRDEITTVIHPNPKGVIVPSSNTLKGIPKLGQVQVRGLSRRWRNPDGSIPDIAIFKIIKRNGRFYVQLTGNLERSYSVKPTQDAIGIDPGLKYEITTSRGDIVVAQQRYRKKQSQRAKLQRAIAKKRTQNLILWLHHPDRKIRDLRQHIPLSNESWVMLKTCKTENAMVEVIGASRVNTLKFNAVPPSKRLQSLEKQASKLESELGRSRKADDDKLTSKLVRNHAFIAIENGLQHEKLRGRAKAKIREDGKGYDRNNAKAKSGLNKSLSDASPGRKIAMLDRKAKRSGREFRKVEAPYTSRLCPCCGSEHPPDFEMRVFNCLTCGWVEDRDKSAGVNIELKAFAISPAELSPLADMARAFGCMWVESNPKGAVPLWLKGLKGKKLANALTMIRALYGAKDWADLQLKWEHQRNSI
jgi:putative transposase